MMLCEVFVSIVLTMVKLAPLCIPTSLRTADVFPVVASPPPFFRGYCGK